MRLFLFLVLVMEPVVSHINSFLHFLLRIVSTVIDAICKDHAVSVVTICSRHPRHRYYYYYSLSVLHAIPYRKAKPEAMNKTTDTSLWPKV